MKFTLKIVFKNGYVHSSKHIWEDVKNKKELHNKFSSFLTSDENAFGMEGENSIHYFIKSEIACISINIEEYEK